MTPDILYFVGAMVLLAGVGYAVYRDKAAVTRRDPFAEDVTRERHPERIQHRRHQRVAERAGME